MLGHILVNGVAASVHMTEDYEHEHEAVHSHLLSNNEHVINDDGQHDHGEGAHMHLEFQLSDMVKVTFKQCTISSCAEVEWLFSTLSLSPPVPPPTR
tara:strand:- start:198 stop:488 length:291 start_codon:yes stop_codon:yes gene_type:complete